MSTRTLFSMVEVTARDGSTSLQVDWHPGLYPALDELSPDGKITDRIIDTAEELLHAFDDADAKATAPQSAG